MKSTAIILLSACLAASANGHSQNVTLTLKDAPLEKVFTEIKKQTGYTFVYKTEALTQTHKVDITVSNASLQQVLDLCFKDQPLTYKIFQRIIAVKSKDDPTNLTDENLPPPPIDVKGRIVNENGEPVIATITEKGTKNAVASDANGYFELKNVNENATLVISGVNIEAYEVKVAGKADLATLTVKTRVVAGEDVQVVSTGYQQIPKERATGAFTQIDNALYNRGVGSDVLSRLYNVTPGLSFDSRNPSKNGISIRGISSINSVMSRDPLIILDNFPFEGDINNLNPNDVESITILKDAAAASIWGARAGNGVIVITTKKGKLNQKPQVELNTNISISERPSLFSDDKYVGSSTFIDIERYLFEQGFYNTSLLPTNRNFPAISPVVEILDKLRKNQITSGEADQQLNVLKSNDVRSDYERYIYRPAITNRHSASVRGGGDKSSYYFGLGFDDNSENRIGNSSNRISLKSSATYNPFKNIEFYSNLTYTQASTDIKNNFAWSAPGAMFLYDGVQMPYAKLIDEFGNAAALPRSNSNRFKDSVQRLGFLDWQFRPLDEIQSANNTSAMQNLIVNLGIKYRILTDLSFDIQFQREIQNFESVNIQSLQVYATRNLINQYSQYNSSTRALTYPIPLGGQYSRNASSVESNNLRISSSYNYNKGDHSISALIIGEGKEVISEGNTDLAYGYDDNTGLSVSNLDYLTSFVINGSTAPRRIPAPPVVTLSQLTRRFLSFSANAAYSYLNRYTFSFSTRTDGANLLGVKTKDKIKPFWSTGLLWDITKEQFYRLDLIPKLKFRATYGYAGNVYNGSAFLIAATNISSVTNLPYLNIQGTQAPNPELRWEKVRTINFGVDFTLKGNRVTGSIDVYKKDEFDLLDQVQLAGSSGFTSFLGNYAETRGSGYEISLNSVNIKRSVFSWSTLANISFAKDKVTRYSAQMPVANVVQQFFGSGNNTFLGYSRFSIFSYRFAGLDPINGDPLGFRGESISKDYVKLINPPSVDSLIYHGSGRPLVTGNLMNTVTLGKLSISANIAFKLKYFIRRPSLSLNYQQLLYSAGSLHSDYEKRWQNPGDELITDIPSIVYATNTERDRFYRYSSALVEKGDHIRLQDVQIQYNFDKSILRNLSISRILAYCNISNLGIVWRANNRGIDPDTYSSNSYTYPIPKMFTFGVKMIF